jgi:ferredoxin
MMSAQNAAACIRPAIVIVFSIKLRSPAQCAARGRCGSCRQLIAANAAAATPFTVRHAAVRRPFSRGDGAHIAC